MWVFWASILAACISATAIIIVGAFTWVNVRRATTESIKQNQRTNEQTAKRDADEARATLIDNAMGLVDRLSKEVARLNEANTDLMAELEHLRENYDTLYTLARRIDARLRLVADHYPTIGADFARDLNDLAQLDDRESCDTTRTVPTTTPLAPPTSKN